jgi:hypothetical protein
MTAEEAHGIEGTNVKNPPKVIFKNQHGKARPPDQQIWWTDNAWQATQYLIIRRRSCMGMTLESKGLVDHFIRVSVVIGRGPAEQHGCSFRAYHSCVQHFC